MMINHNRRKFLIALQLVALSSTFLKSAPAQSISRKSITTQADAMREFLRALPENPASKKLGQAYLAQHPAENDFDRLLATILDPYAPASSSSLRASISARLQEDLMNDKVLFLDGWPITVTEARLCALRLLS